MPCLEDVSDQAALFLDVQYEEVRGVVLHRSPIAAGSEVQDVFASSESVIELIGGLSKLKTRASLCSNMDMDWNVVAVFYCERTSQAALAIILDPYDFDCPAYIHQKKLVLFSREDRKAISDLG